MPALYLSEPAVVSFFPDWANGPFQAVSCERVELETWRAGNYRGADGQIVQKSQRLQW